MDSVLAEVEETRERRFVVRACSMCVKGRYLFASSGGRTGPPASCISVSWSFWGPFAVEDFAVVEGLGVGYSHLAWSV